MSTAGNADMAQEPSRLVVIAATFLFFVSGACALVYEVLWMKELSLLFGNSAQAAAATLAAFFSGIAAGNAYWGRLSSRVRRPLRAYGLLELGVAASAVLYFGIFLVYDSVYPTLFGLFEEQASLFILVKFTLAFALFFPAAFFMGGTLPLMTQFLVRNKDTLGKRASMVYAINTFGAASGAIAAGFVLPQVLGFRTSYLVAMAATVIVAVVAVLVDRQQTDVRPAPPQNNLQPPTKGSIPDAVYPPRVLTVLAVLSGFAALALQVLWIRMFAQVLHNSVYTYAAILSIFLVGLAFGGTIARFFARFRLDGPWFLPTLLTITALLVAGSPKVFHALTDGGAYVGGDADFAGYMWEITQITTVVVGLPVCVLGILLPYLFKLAERGFYGPGETVGRLVTSNTVAAIAGSVAAGFLLLSWLGLWMSLQLIAALYGVAALWLIWERRSKNLATALPPLAGLLLVFTVLDATDLAVVRIDSDRKNERLLKVWEGADATVAVVERDGFLRTKLNNWYTLGGTGDITTQQVQTHLPMMLHEAPRRIFYLGMGTGITAGTVLNYDVEAVVVAEIASSVIRASREFFASYTNGLYEDSRVTVIAEDGRNALRGTHNEYDLIISDLFVPWRAGVGTLYSVEHYETSVQRLQPGGMYVQWLPLYQLSEEEFSIIARTMTEVFPSVTVWRGNFSPNRPIFALIGHRDEAVLPTKSPLLGSSRMALREHASQDGDTIPLIAHYAGSLTRQHFANVPVNTDNHQVIEYLAPINHRREKAGLTQWFVEEPLLSFIGKQVNQAALQDDPYLTGIDPAWSNVIQAGYYFQVLQVLELQKHADAPAAEDAYRNLLRRAARAVR